MQTSDLAMLAFTVGNALRVVAYVPQFVSVIRDGGRCAAFSCSTWTMFLFGHTSAAVHVLLNVHDTGMGAMFAGNAFCCAATLAVVFFKRWRWATPQVADVGTSVSNPDRIPIGATIVQG